MQAADGETPLMTVTGMGGTVRLYADRLEISRHRVVQVFLEHLVHHQPQVDTIIYLDTITAVHVMRPLLFVEYIRFAFAGAPNPMGSYWGDAFADNAIIMNLFDNREFFALVARIEAILVARRPNGRAAVRAAA